MTRPAPLLEITAWLETATRGLPPQTRALAAQELAAHYADAVAAHRAANIPEYEARNLALAELGDPNETALGLRSAHLPLRRLWAGLAASLLFPVVFGLIAIGYPLIGETLAYLILDLCLIGTAWVVMPVFQRLPQLSPIALEKPVWALTITLTLGMGSRVVYHLVYNHPLFYPASYYFLPAAPWPETVLFLSFLSCQILIGAVMLWLASKLLTAADPLYGLRLPLIALLAVMGASGVGLGVSLAVNFMTGVDLFSVTGNACLTLTMACMALLFFRTAYRPVTFQTPASTE